jgi:hypothetical protein
MGIVRVTELAFYSNGKKQCLQWIRRDPGPGELVQSQKMAATDPSPLRVWQASYPKQRDSNRDFQDQSTRSPSGHKASVSPPNRTQFQPENSQNSIQNSPFSRTFSPFRPVLYILSALNTPVLYRRFSHISSLSKIRRHRSRHCFSFRPVSCRHRNCEKSIFAVPVP